MKPLGILYSQSRHDFVNMKSPWEIFMIFKAHEAVESVEFCHLSHEKRAPGWFKTQLYRDYHKLLQGSLLNNQCNGK